MNVEKRILFRYDVWVKKTEEDGYEYIPRTTFHIIAVGKDIPEDLVQVIIISKHFTI